MAQGEPTAEACVAEIVEIYGNASTFPCRVVTEAGAQWVMKLRGSGPGAMSLMTEYLALHVAREMGLAVPECRPLYLPPGFPWTIGTDEFDGIVQRSYGWNLGIAYMADSAPASAADVREGDPAFLACLMDVDRALFNTDRSERNPNILRMADKRLVAIDFDACLFLRRAVRESIPAAFDMPPGHLLGDLDPPRDSYHIGWEALPAAMEGLPDPWFEVLNLSREQVERGLRAYIAAWNAWTERP